MYQQRNNFFRFIISCLLLFSVAAVSQAAELQKIVYHLSDPQKIGLALTNMDFHIKGAGGPENVDIKIVVNGAAVKGFVAENTPERMKNRVASLQENGVDFEICGNALNYFELTIDQLLPGLTELPQGGVARIGELQMQGYGYIKP